MQKVVARVDEGKIGVLYQVDKRQVFSEDFKAIVRSMMLGNVVKAYMAGELKEGDDAPMDETLKDVIQIVVEAVPSLMAGCLEGLKDDETYAKEMADLGLTPPDAGGTPGEDQKTDGNES